MPARSSAPPTSDVLLNRRAQMFPTLSDAQVARVARVATTVELPEGSLLFDEGDYGIPFFVVLEGAITVVHPNGSEEEPIIVHGPHDFTGEMSMLAGRRGLVRGRVTKPSRLLRVELPQFRNLMQTDSDLSEVLMRAFILRRVGLLQGAMGDAIVIGSRLSAATLRVQAFLTRNGHPHRYIDIDTEPDVPALLDGFKVSVADLPVLICRGEKVLKNPSNAEVAECLGFNQAIDPEAKHDVVIVGAGPAGLAAAVYAASEGLDVLVLEATAPGGQAGSSSKIENYLGFPTGISGQALAQRALTQAEKFGAKLAIAQGAVCLHCDRLPYRVEVEGGGSFSARAIVIATGAEYRRLELPNLERFEGAGVYYGATFLEAQRCAADEVIVVGGGNSAGQAAIFLAQTSRHVHVLIRGESLAASMSNYLIRRIEESSNVTLHTRTEIVELNGAESLESVVWRDATGTRTALPIQHVFSMTGAKPNTEWLQRCLELDEKGFILTGYNLSAEARAGGDVSVVGVRPKAEYETSLPRVFAVGDVRSGSTKRVAAGVGEGSACISLVHRALAEA
ncbi:MAG TPA: FAD-dependent oxidoreductase [Polyangiaceae bacterium]|jgi:thioredoxin reductase (NADPH)|nr:FAD-dependent oxidoreductase [Polyangiaceae bacterium]